MKLFMTDQKDLCQHDVKVFVETVFGLFVVLACLAVMVLS